MLENTFFCVHIPKTGGTSFRKAFESLVGSKNTYYDYGKQSDVTSKLIKNVKYKSDDLYSICKSELSIKKQSFICGHVNVMDYSNIILPENIFTFLRNPVDRVVSHYEHLTRRNDYSGSLRDFCQEEKYRNLQHKTLSNYPLHAIGFIGITEEFSKSLEMLKLKYGLYIPELELNKNTNKAINNEYPINETLASLIISMNELDILLYSRAKKLFNKRLKSHLDHNIYGHIENISSKSVTGWCYRTSSDDELITVDILVNGELVGAAKTVIYRPFFKQINTPREGYVGFKYYFKSNITSSDLVTCRVKGTEYYLTDIAGNYETLTP